MREMAEADLDVVIRSMAKKQVKTLADAAKKRQGRLMGMAGKAKDKESRDRYRQLARTTRKARRCSCPAPGDHGGEYRGKLRPRDQEGGGGVVGSSKACQRKDR